MKKLLLLTLALMLFVLPAMADSNDATIKCTGSATVTLEPDYAGVIIGANTSGDTVADASTQNAAVMQSIQDALLALGIAKDDIATQSFYLNPRYSYQSDTPALIGYQVEHMLSVTVRDLNMLNKVLDDAMAAGANQTYGINFLSTRQSDAFDQALTEAIQEAARKAELMAAAAGKKLGAIIEIEENNAGYPNFTGRTSKLEAAMDAAGTSIQSGTLEVSAGVTVVYEIK